MEISKGPPNRLHTIEYLHCGLLLENCFSGNTVIVRLYWALLLLPWCFHGPVIGLYYNFVFCMLCKWVVFLPLVNSCNIVINSRSLPQSPSIINEQKICLSCVNVEHIGVELSCVPFVKQQTCWYINQLCWHAQTGTKFRHTGCIKLYVRVFLLHEAHKIAWLLYLIYFVFYPLLYRQNCLAVGRHANATG